MQLPQSIEMVLPCRQCRMALLFDAHVGFFTPGCGLVSLVLAFIVYLLLVRMSLLSLINLIAATLYQRQLLTPRCDVVQQVLPSRLDPERLQCGQAGVGQRDKGIAFARTGNAGQVSAALRDATHVRQCLRGNCGSLAAFVRYLALALEPGLGFVACALRRLLAWRLAWVDA